MSQSDLTIGRPEFSRLEYESSEPLEESAGRSSGGSEVRLILRTLRRHGWLIVSIVGVTGVCTAISQLFATPMYRSVSTVQVELTDEEGRNRAEAEARNAIRVENEAKTYRSAAVAAKVIEDLDLINNAQFMGDSMDIHGDFSESERARAVTKLTKMVRIINNAQSDLVDIEASSPYPELAAKIANQIPVSAQEMRVSRRQRMRRRMLADLEQESQRLAAKLAEAENRVGEFRRDASMLEGAGSLEDLQQINRIAVEAASAQALSSAAAARSAGISRAAGIVSFASAASPLLQQQRQRRAELQTEKSRLSGTFGVGHPQIIGLTGQIAELDTAIRTEEAQVQNNARLDSAAEAEQQRALAASESAAAGSRAGQLQGMLGSMAAKAYANNANKAQLAQLEREAEVTRSAYMSIVSSEEEVRAALGIIGVNSTLISTAVPQSEPYYPKPMRTIVGALLASLAISVLIVFARELLDDKLRSPSQIFRLFRLKTFGMLPMLGGTQNGSIEENPVINQPHSIFAEVARGVHSEVLDLAKPKKVQTVFLTSPIPGEGKSTVAISLCAAAAAAGRRAIVVDLDLRHPGICQQMQRQTGGPDLVDLLLQPEERLKLPPPQNHHGGREVTSYDPVVLSTRETVHNPAAIFAYEHMRRLFGRLHEDFDLVVINGPAVLAAHDVRSLARFADSTLMVLIWGQTTVSQLEASLSKLGNRVDGVVFDAVDFAEHARRGYQDEVQYYMESTRGYAASVKLGKNVRRNLAALGNRFLKLWTPRWAQQQ